jgi:hypothetical protein
LGPVFASVLSEWRIVQPDPDLSAIRHIVPMQKNNQAHDTVNGAKLGPESYLLKQQESPTRGCHETNMSLDSCSRAPSDFGSLSRFAETRAPWPRPWIVKRNTSKGVRHTARMEVASIATTILNEKNEDDSRTPKSTLRSIQIVSFRLLSTASPLRWFSQSPRGQRKRLKRSDEASMLSSLDPGYHHCRAFVPVPP